MTTLGISAFYHDSACALVDDSGRVVAAAQEERFTRKKHDSSFPANAVGYCLQEAGIPANAVDHVVFYDRPFEKFARLLDSISHLGPVGLREGVRALAKWSGGKLDHESMLTRGLREIDAQVGWEDRLLFTEHHVSHAASAFFASPFESAVILTIDGVGERSTTTVALGDGNRLELVKELDFPNSLGLLYSAFTHYAGFRINSGEYKLMGLAPYGEPRFVDVILENLIDVKDDGSFAVDSSYFHDFASDAILAPRFLELFGRPARQPDVSIGQFHMDIAASIQAVVEVVMLRMTKALASEYGRKHLCLAGGVALNCVANGKIARSGAFDEIWIQPAAGDAGGALGAALFAHHSHLGRPRAMDGKRDIMGGAYLGPAYSDAEIAAVLDRMGATYTRWGDDDLIAKCAEILAQDETLGWFQGRMEFGPRALGARSILANARSSKMQQKLNLQIKKRESFRPFAPAVIEEAVDEWFEGASESPYMLVVYDVAADKRTAFEPSGASGFRRLQEVRSSIPAVTHVDYSARVQTVSRSTNPRFHALITKTGEHTGAPVVVNTSFNVRGEPLVCTPEDAFRCFMNTELDYLAMGNLLLSKDDQDPLLALSLAQTFPED